MTPKLSRDCEGAVRLRTTTLSAVPGSCGLKPSEPEHDTAGIADIVLMAAKALRAVDLSHDVLNLDRLQGDVLGQGIVQTTSSRHGEGVLRDRAGIEIVPDIPASEQELDVRSQARVAPPESRAEHVGKQPVVDPGVGVTAEVRDQADHVVDVIRKRSGATVTRALPILVGRVQV